MDISYLDNCLRDRQVVILGFGREGKALLNWLLKRYPGQTFHVADENLSAGSGYDPGSSDRVVFHLGAAYLEDIQAFDLIIKTPGIPMRLLQGIGESRITSQTDLFLSVFGDQVIGVTGTKGKSTTTSLIYHIMKRYNPESVLSGNIGIPPFSVIDQIGSETPVVMELSSHQLELVKHSPRIALLLNIFEEHLDHYDSYEDYQQAKYRIARFQQPSGFFIYNQSDDRILSQISKNPFPGKGFPFSSVLQSAGFCLEGTSVILRTATGHKITVLNDIDLTQLKGRHNQGNVMAAVAACHLWGVTAEVIQSAVADFKPLEHRLELVGTRGGIDFYNDSISTIPEATLAAIESLGKVYTLLLGGHDRGIDYSKLAEISNKPVSLVLLTGEAGRRIMNLLRNVGFPPDRLIYFSSFSDMVIYACNHTPKGEICLLSPAASSYDQFRNFEERGKVFKDIINSNFRTED